MLSKCILVLVTVATLGAAWPCSPDLTVAITNGTKDGTVITHGGISYTSANYFNYSGEIRGCVCNIKPCIRKCCPENKFFYGTNCTEAFEYENVLNVKNFNVHHGNLSLQIPTRDYATVFGSSCPVGYDKFKLNSSYENYFLQENGSLLWVSDDSINDGTMLNVTEYCFEVFDDSEVGVLVCNEFAGEDIVLGNSIGMIISTPFLLATFLVYLFVPELQNLHGKSLMCYVISLFTAYMILVVIQLNPESISSGACVSLAAFCYFGFMASFFWMNVMCLDIWWAFSGYRGFSGTREAERKRFIYYSIYAWGLPLFILIIILAIRFSGALPGAWYNAGFGEGRCWFNKDISTFVYFYGPIALTIVTNLVMFILTALKIRSVRKDTKVLKRNESQRHSSNENEQRFNLYVKLLMAMGLNWSMEIISWAVKWAIHSTPKEIWLITDFCNALYGVFIFFIFVFKRNIWKLLKKRYFSLRGRPMRGQSLTHSTSHTRSTGLTRSLSHSIPEKNHESIVLTNQVA